MQGHIKTKAVRNIAPPAGRVRALAGVFLLILLGSSAYEAFKALLLPPLPFWQGHAITFISGSALATVIAARVLRDAERQEAARRRTEEGLHQQEQQYRMVFEDATHGIYRTTPDGRILLANPAMMEMLGFETFQDLAARNLETEGTGNEYERTEFRRQIEADG